MELNNGVEVDQVNLFGMYAFNSQMAMTYDLPVYKDIEGPLGQSESGIGDLGLRFFYKPDATQFEKSSHIFGNGTYSSHGNKYQYIYWRQHCPL